MPELDSSETISMDEAMQDHIQDIIKQFRKKY
jgi:hypothetical protein